MSHSFLYLVPVGDEFLLNQKSTVGVDYKARIVEIGGENIKLQVLGLYCRENIWSKHNNLDMGYCWTRAISFNDISVLQ